MSKPFYIYAADVWCESCGEDIRRRITEAGEAPADPDDERSYDSDEYPKGPYSDEESGSPQHCASGPDCLEAVVWPDGSKSGAFLENPLTMHGYDYVLEKFREERTAVTRLWMDFYGADVLAQCDPWYRGYKAYYDGLEPDWSPFDAATQRDGWNAWLDGWKTARKDDDGR